MSFVPAIKFNKSVWVEFTALAAKYAKANIGQGFQDDPIPDFVANILKKVAEHSERTDWHQYTRSFGHPRLVNVLAKLYSGTLGMAINPQNNILVTGGAYLALSYSFSAWLNKGDEVIIFEPAFDSYVPQIEMAGGVPVVVLLQLPQNATRSSDYHFDSEGLEKKLTKKTKMIVLNNPHNPTGKLFTMDELQTIANFAKRHNLIVLSDEVYEWHVYKCSGKMIRFASLPGMYERTITVGSAGKAFSVTGWKTGWAIGPEVLLEPLKAIHQNFVYTCCTPIQEALAEAFERELELFEDAPEKSYLLNLMANHLQAKRDRMAALLRTVGMKPVVPDAGYFMMADFTAIRGEYTSKACGSDEPLDVHFARWLCKEKKLAVIPPSAFYSKHRKLQHQNMIRVCFSKSDETFAEVERILEEIRASIDR